MSNLPNIEATAVLDALTQKLATSIREVTTYEVLVKLLSEERENLNAQLEQAEQLNSELQSALDELKSQDDAPVSGEVIE